MPVKRTAPQASVTEVLDRVLDRGIVIDAWLRVSVAGITLIDVDARVVVASIDTYVQWSSAMAGTRQVSRPSPHGDEPATERRAAPRPGVRLSCSSGCSFVRSAARVPSAVRCPIDRGRVCAVMVVPAVPHPA
jgi:hypothetical protein